MAQQRTVPVNPGKDAGMAKAVVGKIHHAFKKLRRTSSRKMMKNSVLIDRALTRSCSSSSDNSLDA